MAAPVPAIRLTDPQSKDANPVYPLSPELPAQSVNGRWETFSASDDSPRTKRNSTNSDRDARPTSPIARAGAMVRGISTNLVPTASKREPSPMVDNRTSQPEQSVAVDPVTQQIYDRQGSTNLIAERRNSAETTQSGDDHVQRADSVRNMDSPPRSAMRMALEVSRTQKKDNRVSFFSRIIHGKKKDSQDILPDDASIMSRPEGHDAEVFSPALPHPDFAHAQPETPAYIRVKSRHSRKKRHFDNLFLAQELVAETPSESNTNKRASVVASMPTIPQCSAWAAEFSKDGRYLATAGHDGIIRVWAVITTPAEREEESRICSSDPAARTTTAAVFKSKPHREYRGHASTILDLSWSKNGFLISSSMDKTVKLWHVSRDQCLCTFKHKDFVPTVCFHPKDDRYFLTGSLDCKLRMWSVQEKRVAYWCSVPSMITAVTFTPDGKSVIAGCADGSCLFYDTDGLRYQTQVKVKSAQGKHDKGAKITGLQTFAHHLHKNIKLVVTSNDSRVRLYNYRDKSLEWKLKGSVNNTCQISAAVSDDGCYIGCGSEDKRAYIWPMDSSSEEDPSKRPLEHFQAHDSMVTCVRFAPAKTRSIIGHSGDPIFDVCNSAMTSIMRSSTRDETVSEVSSRHAPETAGSSTPPSLTRQTSDHSSRSPTLRCSHVTGNIIVTASQMGSIKVFRQDCAARHRFGSTSSRKLSNLGITRRGTTSLRSKQSTRSLQSTNSTQAPSDRILSWRQDINASPAARSPSIGSRQSLRSLSPTSARHPAPSKSSTHGHNPLTNVKRLFHHPNASSQSSLPSPSPERETEPERPSTVPRQGSRSPGFDTTTTQNNPLSLQGAQSDLFWNGTLANVRNLYSRMNAAHEDAAHESHDHGLLRPGGVLSRHGSDVSKLSIERTLSSSGSATGSGGIASPA